MKSTSKAVLLLSAALLLGACHIGAGFDTAEKRRRMAWQDEAPQQVAGEPEQLPPAAKQGVPIIYLLVAG